MSSKNGFIKNQTDFTAGLLVFLLGVAALYLSSPLPLGKGSDLGPGSFPIGISWILMGLGCILIGFSIFQRGQNLDWYFVRTFIFIMALAGLGYVMRNVLTGFVSAPKRGSSLDWSIIISVFTIIGLVFYTVHLAKTNEKLAQFVNRGPLFILSAILTFAVLIRPLGLAVAGPLLVLLSANSLKEVKWKDTIIFALCLTAVCIFLFRVVLKQAIPIAPWAGF